MARFSEVEILKSEDGKEIILSGQLDQMADYTPQIYLPIEMIPYFIDQLTKVIGQK